MRALSQKIGVVGLGRIGGGLCLQALEKGIEVAGYSRSGPSKELIDAGLRPVRAPEEFRRELPRPRLLFLYVPAGPTVDQVLGRLLPTLDPGDVVVDGGNSYWKDSLRRERELRRQKIHFVDLGTSGGVEGARRGACFMAGGSAKAFSMIRPVLEHLSAAGGIVHAGPAGAGHFTKLVHNGIEFGMLQAIGEGVDLLERYPQDLDVGGILRCWRNGSVIRSWLVDLLEREYGAQGGLERIPGHVEDTGEVNWLVGDALDLDVAIPVITHAVLQLLASRDDRKLSARAVAMMRHRFGEHPYGPNRSIRQARATSRVGATVSGWSERGRPPRPDPGPTAGRRRHRKATSGEREAPAGRVDGRRAGAPRRQPPS
jgi:6-phosphogluconate dehydrogenase